MNFETERSNLLQKMEENPLSHLLYHKIERIANDFKTFFGFFIDFFIFFSKSRSEEIIYNSNMNSV